MALPTLEEMYKTFQKQETESIAANLKRETEIRGMYDNLISLAKTGGAAKTAGLADIEKSKTQAIGSGMQQLISSGLFGTTTAAALPMRAEADASINRLKLEDMLEQRTSALTQQKAGFVERINDPPPDYNMLFNAMLAEQSKPKPEQTNTMGTLAARRAGMLR